MRWRGRIKQNENKMEEKEEKEEEEAEEAWRCDFHVSSKPVALSSRSIYGVD